MPYASINDAVNDILKVYKDAWDAQTAPVPPTIYDNVAGQQPADGSAWVRVQVKHNPGAGGQTTIGGDAGNKRFTRYGMVVCELYVPTGKGKSAYTGFVETIMRAFEGKSARNGGAFFFNVRPQEVGQEGDWFKVNVIAEFSWDQIR
jgi:hypothetical protein